MAEREPATQPPAPEREPATQPASAQARHDAAQAHGAGAERQNLLGDREAEMANQQRPAPDANRPRNFCCNVM